MIIDRHNCEAFFLDYHEGNLTPVQQGEVLLFLEENPDLKNTFEEYESISLEQENILFPEKDVMKKKYSAEGIESLLSSEITTDNCEQFFIAFVEGQLSSERISKLNSFLANNPNQQKEFELFKKAKLSDEKISFEGKESLNKSLITKENCEEYFIRSAEKDLNRVEEEQLKLFLQKNPEFKKEFELFSKAILPVEQIVFADKSSLKKKERKPVFVSIFSQRTTYYAAAAAILLLMGLFFIFRNDGIEKQILADKNKPVKKVKNVVVPAKEDNSQVTIQNSQEEKNQSPVASGQQHIVVKKNNIAPQIENKEEKKLQPIVIEDEEKLVAEKENEKPKMIEPIVIAEKKQEEKKNESINQSQTLASVSEVKNKDDEYQTIGSFLRKKVRQTLGIKKSECSTDDRITGWDLAMAAKDKIQNVIGNKVDVEKVCDGKGDSEYVFTAGNFQFARSATKKD